MNENMGANIGAIHVVNFDANIGTTIDGYDAIKFAFRPFYN